MNKSLLALWNWYTHWFVPAAVLVLLIGGVIGGGSWYWWYWDRTHLSDSELREIVTVVDTVSDVRATAPPVSP